MLASIMRTVFCACVLVIIPCMRVRRISKSKARSDNELHRLQQLVPATQPIHVLIIEGSSHPGRKNEMAGSGNGVGYVGLPLYVDLLQLALQRFQNVEVTQLVSPPKNEVFTSVAKFLSHVEPGALSIVFYSGHGVQRQGEQLLVFESPPQEEIVIVQPSRKSGRARMVEIDHLFAAELGADWLRQGWTISEVDGEAVRGPDEFNAAVSQAARANELFSVTFTKGGPIDFVSYDELRQLFQGNGPSLHFIDACRVVHDRDLGFNQPDDEPEISRMKFLRTSPIPSDVATIFAVKPGKAAMHEGAGSKPPRIMGREFMGNTMSDMGLLQSKYARDIVRAANRSTLVYHNSYFAEQVAQDLGKLMGSTLAPFLDTVGQEEFGRYRQGRWGDCHWRTNGPMVKEDAGVWDQLRQYPVSVTGQPFVPPTQGDECKPQAAA